MIQYLNAKKIATGIHYPIPLHLQKAYEFLNYSAGDFPVSERYAAEILSLPMFPHISEPQLERVANEVLAFTSSHSRKVAEGPNAPLVSAGSTV